MPQNLIEVPKGFTPVHSFDLIGTLMNLEEFGRRRLAGFRELVANRDLAIKCGVDLERAEEYAALYLRLLNKDPTVRGPRTTEIVNAVIKPLEASGIKVNYHGIFYDDALGAIDNILSAGQGVIIFSTQYQPWLRETLPAGIASRVGNIYGDHRKTEHPEAFQDVYQAEERMQRMLVTHTADELKELQTAEKSGRFKHLIFVNRLSQDSQFQTGIEMTLYSGVTTLAMVKYQDMVVRQK
jgi:hypothetical protein